MTTGRRRYPRTARVNEAVLEVLADELERMSDPRLELVTLTGVEVSRDLSYATVYYSTLGATTAAGSDTVAAETFAGAAATALRAAGSHLRGVLGRQLRIRQVPRLDFEVDAGIVRGQRIEAILRDIHHGRRAEEEAVDAGGEEDS